MEQAKEDALRELAEKAQALGANGILGVDLDFETIGGGGSMLMVIATGTAVRLYSRTCKAYLIRVEVPFWK